MFLVLCFKEKDKFGDTDGIFFHERKFSCPANKGLFVSIDKLMTKLGDSFVEEYAKQAAYGLAPSRTFKITFVGPEGSGKTSSIRTLLGKAFNPHESSTIGAVLGIQAIIKWFMGNTNTEDKQCFNLQLFRAIGWKETSINDTQQILDKEFNKEMSSKLASGNSELKSAENSDTTEPVNQQEENENADKQSNMEMFSKLTSNNSDHSVLNLHTAEPVIIETVTVKAENTDEFQELDIVGKEINVAEEDSEQYTRAKNVVFGDKIDELDSHACISDFAGQLTFFSFQLFF